MKVRGVVTGVVKTLLLKDKDAIKQELTVEDYAAGDHFLKLLAMQDTAKMMETQDLSSLAPYQRDGIMWTKGRLGMSLQGIGYGGAGCILSQE